MTYRLSASSDIIVIGSTLPYFLVLKSDIFFSFWYRYFGITGTVCGGTDGTTFRRYRETLLVSPEGFILEIKVVSLKNIDITHQIINYLISG